MEYFNCTKPMTRAPMHAFWSPLCDVMHKTCSTPYHKPIIVQCTPYWELRRQPPQHLNEQISETITPNSVKFCMLTTNWLLYKCVQFYFKRVIIVEVIRKTKVVSLISGHGVQLMLLFLFPITKIKYLGYMLSIVLVNLL